MSLSTEDKSKTEGDKPPPGWLRALKRYAPFAVVIIVVIAAIAIFGSGGGDDDEGEGGEETAVSNEELIRAGPMTPQKAELLGEDVDFGPNCDAERGTLAIPSPLAPPCVEPFTGDNGGATSMGVTADEIKIITYRADPALDPLGASMVGGAGADVNPETAQQAVEGYADLYNEIFETYGRRVVIEEYTGTGAGSDAEAARNDAIAIAEREPFAVIGGPGQASPVFSAELASRGVVCGPGCAAALPDHLVEDNFPYLWQAGPTPDQAAALAAELFGNLAGPGPAELAGDPEMQGRDRVYALVHYDTPDGDHQPVFEELRDQLAENGIELATDVEFTLDFARMQENARTIISRLKEADVTSVIYYGDPLTPGALTEEATAQDYRPEWLLGPSALMDTTIFARLTDQTQWQHGFGLSLISARGERSTLDPWRIWEWSHNGETPPNNTVGVLEPPVRTVFTGIHLAGPNLTPETFRDGLYRYPVTGGTPTTPQVSRGDHGVWPGADYGGTDDATIIWWDPDATGEDETGNQGQGMYRYANGGDRYTLGNLPTSAEEAGLFNDESSVTVYDELPEEDQVPDYPPPDF